MESTHTAVLRAAMFVYSDFSIRAFLSLSHSLAFFIIVVIIVVSVITSSALTEHKVIWKQEEKQWRKKH